MSELNRRRFLGACAAASALPGAALAAPARPRIGVVHSSHAKLARPSGPDDELDYERVRAMVWQSIEYAGGFAHRVRPRSWLVIKPNFVFLGNMPNWRIGDTTDMRVVKAVLEYVAEKAPATRVTVAEGGSYRRRGDNTRDRARAIQDGTQVDMLSYDWGTKEYPGFGGSLGNLLQDLNQRYPGKRFDYIDLAYDAVRNPDGSYARIEVPKAPNGQGAFGARPDYHVTNTIRNCEFLITVPVAKIHLQCGITACLKSYVGTAPRVAYGAPGHFSNVHLHSGHSVDNRIDPFITDLAAFHPPDFSVVDGIRGLQYQEHNVDKDDQTVRRNLVMASADSVAADALLAHMMGFDHRDIEFLHLAEKRGMGTLNLGSADIAGDDPERLRHRWTKPRGWYGRGNREWRVTASPEAPERDWKRVTTPGETLDFAAHCGSAPAYAASAVVHSPGHRKAFLWMGLRGKAQVWLNGERVAEEEIVTRYRVGQIQRGVELKPGENRLRMVVEARDGAKASVLMVGPRNDGDTLGELKWSA